MIWMRRLVCRAAWALAAPVIPTAKCGCRPRDVSICEVLSAIFYMLWTSTAEEPANKSTAYHYFTLSEWDWNPIHHARYVATSRQASLSGAKRAHWPRSLTFSKLTTRSESQSKVL